VEENKSLCRLQTSPTKRPLVPPSQRLVPAHTLVPRTRINAPNQLVGVERGKRGAGMWQREINGGISTLIARESSFADTECALGLISWGASLRNPYPAFPAAISAQLTVAWAGGDGPRQAH
jgi:hypothetical protein